MTLQSLVKNSTAHPSSNARAVSRSRDTVTTEAWVLYQGHGDEASRPAELRQESISFPAIGDEEVLAEPLFGCWEANMTHALSRQPVDVCQLRAEPKVVLGNAGVVRILQTGAAVTNVAEGDLCLFFCNGVWDRRGYTVLVFAYDAPGTVGLLARRMKAHHRNFIPIPAGSPYTPQQWAAFSLRYVTAWANWQVAYGCWQTQMAGVPPEQTYIAGWGGGVSLAELELARHMGCSAMMIASGHERLAQIEALGIAGIDRQPFAALDFHPGRYDNDSSYRRNYKEAEESFLSTLRQRTLGEGISIFIDNIGTPVFRATLKALARQGVITTTGWKCGMDLSIVRAIECINRHVHVFTHYARYQEGLAAVAFAERTGWLPPSEEQVWNWDEIPRLAADYAAGRVTSYFPLFRINAV